MSLAHSPVAMMLPVTDVARACEFGTEKATWFKDPDGNVVCVHETVT